MSVDRDRVERVAGTTTLDREWQCVWKVLVLQVEILYIVVLSIPQFWRNKHVLHETVQGETSKSWLL
jgi:hypothetical protein